MPAGVLAVAQAPYLLVSALELAGALEMELVLGGAKAQVVVLEQVLHWDLD